MPEDTRYLYGPVPSRRLGLSLGVDIVPSKVCTLDCLYCQVGRTPRKTLERREYAPVADILARLKNRLTEGLKAHYVTISGSGEPTLHCRLGEIVEGIKHLTDIPVAIITNGTLLYRTDVRADCVRADVVLPSLDAGDEATFNKINRPHQDISIEKLISGLCAFRDEFAGQIWLEVLLVEGMNTAPEQIGKIKQAVERISPDKIQLNTAVRPTTEHDIRRLDMNILQTIAERFGPRAEVVAAFERRSDRHIRSEVAHDLPSVLAEDRKSAVLAMLKRRPCSLSDISSALRIRPQEARKHIDDLQRQAIIDSSQRHGITFFVAKSTRIGRSESQ
ncbi:MAG: radical SAM protein [Planctomycetota bacterium]|jgi:wyosine [tRNA(Phe)-imidazoG37] synthetase (radical SAM superfamily)